MTTTRNDDHRNPLVRRLTLAGGTVILLAVAATLAVYPRDPVLDWLDILQEGIFLLGGLGALWGAWRANSPVLTLGALMLTGSLAIDLADEFITPAVVPSQWIPTALSAGGLGLVAWGLAELAARARAGRAELRVSQERIQDYQSRLELAAMKDEFIASMSHELRRPLTAVTSAADTLDAVSGTLTAAQRREVATITQNAARLLALINDILELSRLESGRATISHQAVDIGGTCDAAWTLVSARAQAKSLDVSFSVARDAGSLFTDGRRLKQMLVSLLDNAVKFTPSGGRIGLEVTHEADVVTFTVWDSGPGIAAADQPRLFKPFIQLEAGPNRDQQGTGLGLALVQCTARALGGDARVQSAPGRGSRFSITLPADAPAA